MTVKIEYKGVEFEFDGVPSEEELEARYRAYERSQESAAGVEPIEHHDYGDEAPVSAGQRRMWFLQQANPENVAYHVPQAIRLRGELEVDALHGALSELVRRHEILRTVFPERDGRPVQKIRPAPEQMTWTEHDLREEPEREERAEAIIRDEIARPFELREETPFRVLFIRVGEEEHILLVLYHHIAIDEWTTGILIEELVELYEAQTEGREPRLEEPRIQYADYAIWQGQRLETEEYDRGVEFWREYLEGAPTGIDWPIGREPTGDEHPAEYAAFEWDEQTSERLRATARRADASLFLVVYGIISSFLSIYTGQRDVVLGVPVTMRKRAELQRLVGFMLNTVPMRTRCAPEQSFEEFLADAGDGWNKTQPHQWIPFERIVQEIDAERRADALPLTDVLFTYVPREWGEGRLGAVEMEPYRYGEGPDVKGKVPEVVTPLSLFVSGEDAKFSGELEFDSDRFTRTEIERMVEALNRFVRACMNAPEVPMAAHDVPRPPSADSREPPAERESSGEAEGEREQPLRSRIRDLSPAKQETLRRRLYRDRKGLGRERTSDPSPAVVLQEGTAPPLILFHPVGGSALGYRSFVSAVDDDIPVLGIRSPKITDENDGRESVGDMVEAYVGHITEKYDIDVCHVGGWSIGGGLAFEAASRMERRGISVECLHLFDSRPRLEGDGEARRHTQSAELQAFAADLGKTLGLSTQRLLELRADVDEWTVEEIAERLADLADAQDAASPETIQRRFEVYRRNVRAYREYTPESRQIDATLAVAAPSGEETAVDRGWESFVEGTIERRIFEVGHYELMEPPTVEGVAELVESQYCLDD